MKAGKQSFHGVLLLALFTLFGASSLVFAQLEEVWVRTYGGAGGVLDRPVEMVLDSQGNVYTTGTSGDPLTPTTNDIVTQSYDPFGNLRWRQIYDGPAGGWDEASALAIDDQDNLYVAGIQRRGAFSDAVTVSYDKDGNERWAVVETGVNNIEPADILAVAGGSVWVTGEHVTPPGAGLFLFCYSPATGEPCASPGYQGIGPAYAMAEDSWGDICVTGLDWRFGGNFDMFVACYGTDGFLSWDQTYDSPSGQTETGEHIAVDRAGNLYIGVNVLNAGSDDPWRVVSYDLRGAFRWDKQVYSNPGRLNDMIVDDQGNVFTTGRTTENKFGFNVYHTTALDAAGAQLWSDSYYVNDGDEPMGMAMDDLGNLFVTGNIGGAGAAFVGEMTTLMYDPLGDLQWVVSTPFEVDPTDCGSKGLAVEADVTGEIYVAGYFCLGANDYDMALVQYGDPGIDAVRTRIQERADRYANTRISQELQDGVIVPLNRAGNALCEAPADFDGAFKEILKAGDHTVKLLKDGLPVADGQAVCDELRRGAMAIPAPGPNPQPCPDYPLSSPALNTISEPIVEIAREHSGLKAGDELFKKVVSEVNKASIAAGPPALPEGFKLGGKTVEKSLLKAGDQTLQLVEKGTLSPADGRAVCDELRDGMLAIPMPGPIPQPCPDYPLSSPAIDAIAEPIQEVIFDRAAFKVGDELARGILEDVHQASLALGATPSDPVQAEDRLLKAGAKTIDLVLKGELDSAAGRFVCDNLDAGMLAIPMPGPIPQPCPDYPLSSPAFDSILAPIAGIAEGYEGTGAADDLLKGVLEDANQASLALGTSPQDLNGAVEHVLHAGEQIMKVVERGMSVADGRAVCDQLRDGMLAIPAPGPNPQPCPDYPLTTPAVDSVIDAILSVAFRYPHLKQGNETLKEIVSELNEVSVGLSRLEPDLKAAAKALEKAGHNAVKMVLNGDLSQSDGRFVCDQLGLASLAIPAPSPNPQPCPDYPACSTN